MDDPTPAVDSPKRAVPDDAVDVALAQSGDTQAFERLYRAHVSRVFSLARRMMGPETAEEATQDVFVRAWEKLGSFRGEAAFGTWLHRLAVNLLLSQRARRGRDLARHDPTEDALERRASRGTRPELAMDLETAIGRLPDGARQIFVLHDIEGYKHEEIGDSLGIAVGTSKAQLHRARMLLRSHLEPQTEDRIGP
ncbi:MAG: RNA polymerase sigma factor [Gemmatimonadota bacterium]|nr:RNA polymerase sigma factor [Gemmatimonadota bacterium]MDH4350008.1 RNA polymerase sigma factor [Gemmatimonadota bacterium]MDH5197622.1 RNA polymerase sigma factor [Gemmatimonadota bacterium]